MALYFFYILCSKIHYEFCHLFDLGVKGQSQINIMMVHNTPTKCPAPTYQISLTYLDRQKCYGPYNFRQLFDLEVKGQG